MLFSRYKVAHEKKHKIMRNVASVAEATRSFLAEIDKVENLNRSEARKGFSNSKSHLGPVPKFEKGSAEPIERRIGDTNASVSGVAAESFPILRPPCTTTGQLPDSSLAKSVVTARGSES